MKLTIEGEGIRKNYFEIGASDRCHSEHGAESPRLRPLIHAQIPPNQKWIDAGSRFFAVFRMTLAFLRPGLGGVSELGF